MDLKQQILDILAEGDVAEAQKIADLVASQVDVPGAILLVQQALDLLNQALQKLQTQPS